MIHTRRSTALCAAMVVLALWAGTLAAAAGIDEVFKVSSAAPAGVAAGGEFELKVTFALGEGVNGLLGEDHDQGCEHHDRGQQPERPCGSRDRLG